MARNIIGAQMKYRARLPRFTPTAVFTQHSTVSPPTSSPTEDQMTTSTTDNGGLETTSTSSQSTMFLGPSPTTSISTPRVSSSSLASFTTHSSAHLSSHSGSTTKSSTSSDTTEPKGSPFNNQGGQAMGIIAAVFLGSMTLAGIVAFFWRRRMIKQRAKERSKRYRSTFLGLGPPTVSPDMIIQRTPTSVTLPSQAIFNRRPSIHRSVTYPDTPRGQEAFWRSIDDEVQRGRKPQYEERPFPATESVVSAYREAPHPRYVRDSHHSIAVSRFNEFPRWQQQQVVRSEEDGEAAAAAAVEGGEGEGLGESFQSTSPLDQFPSPPSAPFSLATPVSRYHRPADVTSLTSAAAGRVSPNTDVRSFLDLDEERRASGRF